MRAVLGRPLIQASSDLLAKEPQRNEGLVKVSKRLGQGVFNFSTRWVMNTSTMLDSRYSLQWQASLSDTLFLQWWQNPTIHLPACGMLPQREKRRMHTLLRIARGCNK